MDIKITLKQLGKKHPYLKEHTIRIADIGTNPSLRELLLAIVSQQVAAFNERQEGKGLLPFLSEEEMNAQATTGKISFGARYGNRQAHLEKAKETMLQAFEDGLFVVFLQDEQLENLDATIPLHQDSVFTFLRLAFLSGSYFC